MKCYFSADCQFQNKFMFSFRHAIYYIVIDMQYFSCMMWADLAATSIIQNSFLNRYIGKQRTLSPVENLHLGYNYFVFSKSHRNE